MGRLLHLINHRALDRRLSIIDDVDFLEKSCDGFFIHSIIPISYMYGVCTIQYTQLYVASREPVNGLSCPYVCNSIIYEHTYSKVV